MTAGGCVLLFVAVCGCAGKEVVVSVCLCGYAVWLCVGRRWLWCV